MFREVRKKKNEIATDEIKALLQSCRRGVLAMNGEEGYPYAVPINFLYDADEGKIFFHSGKVGYKVECLKKCDKVCFTVFGNETVKDEVWAPYMQSAVIFGRCSAIEEEESAMERLKKFAMKYYPNESMVTDEIKAAGKAVRMFQIDIEHMSGKEVHER